MSRANPVRAHEVEFDCIHKRAGKVIECCGPLRMLRTNLDQYCQKMLNNLQELGFGKTFVWTGDTAQKERVRKMPHPRSQLQSELQERLRYIITMSQGDTTFLKERKERTTMKQRDS